MRVLAVALVTITTLAADAVSDMGLMPGHDSGWDVTSTACLLFFAFIVLQNNNPRSNP